MKILIIGYGNMGSAVVKRIVDCHECSVIAVSTCKKKPYKNTSFVTGIDNLDDSVVYDVVFIAVKPQIFPSILVCKNLTKIIKNSKLLISIMAGVPVRVLEKEYPGCAIARVMPNLPVSIGKGVLSVLLNQSASMMSNYVQDLLSCLGTIIYVNSEEKFNILSALFGSGCGYIFYFIEQYLNIAKGLDVVDSEIDLSKIILDSFCGSVDYALANKDRSMSDMVAGVESKKGITKAGLDCLRGVDARMSLGELLKSTIDASVNRSFEIDKETEDMLLKQ